MLWTGSRLSDVTYQAGLSSSLNSRTLLCTSSILFLTKKLEKKNIVLFFQLYQEKVLTKKISVAKNYASAIVIVGQDQTYV
jgi:hypothetical protein